VNHDNLIAAGFKHFQSDRTVLQQWDDLYQLRVRDKLGTRYFINIYRWDHTKYGGPYVGWGAELVSNDGAAWWDGPLWLKTSCNNKTTDDVVRWGAELWGRLGLNYYERGER
jgi:hypothetical protein